MLLTRYSRSNHLKSGSCQGSWKISSWNIYLVILLGKDSGDKLAQRWVNFSMTSGCPHAAPYWWRAWEYFRLHPCSLQWMNEVPSVPTGLESIREHPLSWSQIIPVNIGINYIQKYESFTQKLLCQCTVKCRNFVFSSCEHIWEYFEWSTFAV